MEGLRAPLAVLAVALSPACSPESTEQDPVRLRGILAAHRDAGIDPSGRWECVDEDSFQRADIAPVGSADQYFVWFASGTEAGDLTQASGTGTLTDGALTLRLEPDEFDDRFHLCRFGERELLLPENGVWFPPGQDWDPQGRIFARTSRHVEVLGGYLPGPEDESGPMRR
jgi:hypothetical protein